MGPNGSGKSTLSHVLMGRPATRSPAARSRSTAKTCWRCPRGSGRKPGLFLSMQYPIEVPGVSLVDALRSRLRRSPDRDPADGPRAGRPPRPAASASTTRFLVRPLNVDLSGGERKRNETLQLGVLRPQIAVLDEIDSGLDVDALRAVARRIEAATTEDNLGVLAITHYSRLLHELQARRRPRARRRAHRRYRRTRAGRRARGDGLRRLRRRPRRHPRSSLELIGTRHPFRGAGELKGRRPDIHGRTEGAPCGHVDVSPSSLLLRCSPSRRASA